MIMHHIVICELPGSTIFFQIISQTARFKKKLYTLLNIKCVFWFSLQLLSETFLVLRRIQRDMVKNVYWPSCNAPLFRWDFNKSWIFSTGCRKILQYKISWKSVLWDQSCSTRAEIQTDDGLWSLLAILLARFKRIVSPFYISDFWLMYGKAVDVCSKNRRKKKLCGKSLERK